MKRFVTSDEWFSKFFEIILMLQDNSKRAAKELFVTGHAGASLWENEEVILVAVVCECHQPSRRSIIIILIICIYISP